MAVFVLDKRKHRLGPCTPRRARLRLERGRAGLVRRYPSTIRLKERLGGELQRVLQTPTDTVQGVPARHCTPYSYQERRLLPRLRTAICGSGVL
jgi:hypothetical protein